MLEADSGIGNGISSRNSEVVHAGLHDAPGSLKARFAKGSYFALAGRAPFSRLFYPVPEPGGFGVHLALDLGGQARFGPDVEWLVADLNLYGIESPGLTASLAIADEVVQRLGLRSENDLESPH